ncbi:hypothetical protein LH51_16430 [Nitrincola sp. A-D6]|nr:hypothetical protein LH51_16430 [Nitrincola sp. A-D6]
MTVDEFVGLGALWVFKAIFFMLCVLIIAVSVLFIPEVYFPNQTGWNDLSNMELFFLACWIYLTVRYALKVKKYSASVLRAIYRYIIYFGAHSMVFLSMTGLVFIGDPDEGQLFLDMYQEYFDLAYVITLLVLIFSIVPKGKYGAVEAKVEQAGSSKVNSKNEHDEVTEGSHNAG